MKCIVFLLSALTCFFIAGCGERPAEDPRLILAEKCRDEGDFKAAERQLRKYLHSFPDADEVHLKLASLYDESLKDPVGAIYHYREHLRLNPGSPQAEAVNAWIEAAKQRIPGFAEKQDTADRQELERLNRENAALRQLALRQQQELAKLRQPVKPAPVPKAAAPQPAPVRAAVPAAPEEMPSANARHHEYEVRRGDTLGRIARHFYGSSQKIEPILKANGLTARSVLQIGQKLIIPKLAEGK